MPVGRTPVLSANRFTARFLGIGPGDPENGTFRLGERDKEIRDSRPARNKWEAKNGRAVSYWAREADKMYKEFRFIVQESNEVPQTSNKLFSLFKSLGLAGDVERLDEVLRMYRHAGRIPDRVHFWKMNALSVRRRHNELLPTYEQMLQDNMAPGNHVFNLLVSSLARSGRLAEVAFVVQEMVKHGFVPSAEMYNTLIDSYARARNREGAMWWFERMLEAQIQPNVTTYSTMARMHASFGRMEDVLLTLEDMRAAGVQPNVVTYGGLMNEFVVHGNRDIVLEIFEMMLADNIRPNFIVLNTLLKSSVYSKTEAFKTYELFKKYSVRPSIVTLSSLLKATVRTADVELAERVVAEVAAHGLKMDHIIYTTLMSVYAKADLVEKTEETFLRFRCSIKEIDALAFEPIVDVHSRIGNSDRAIELLVEARQIARASRLLGLIMRNFLNRGDTNAISKLLRIGGKPAKETLALAGLQEGMDSPL
ncbi:hypothetical protein NDN08_005137 [Rhodosorus marinus]|uniref:Pentacotripeptide-repeat region of PRORP domain-containing protein n=1 Tax=Rhodosorus marinus TaxID=101924 RepID=A0AAV8V3C1_9RHOD|nr:hypothetical protein NDN08_005137 [Rhodosorus marinus]